MRLQQSLHDLYQDHHAALLQLIREQCTDAELKKVSRPLYLHPLRYAESKRRLVIVGQQTNSWDTDHPVLESTVKEQMAVYQQFDLARYNFPSPFWGFARSLNDWVGNPSHTFLWTNLDRVDYDLERYSDADNPQAKKLFGKILEEELKLLEPEIVVFVVGPSYAVGEYMERKPGPSEVSEQNPVTEMTLQALPDTIALKTYHPNYLQKNPDIFYRVRKVFSERLNFSIPDGY